MDHLLFVRDVLEGSPGMDRLLGSCFGKLFKLPGGDARVVDAVGLRSFWCFCKTLLGCYVYTKKHAHVCK